ARPLFEFHSDKPSTVANVNVRPPSALEGVPVRHDMINAALLEIFRTCILQLFLSHFPAVAAFRAFISARISAAVFFFGVSAAGAPATDPADFPPVAFLTSNGSPGPIQRFTFAN